MFSRILDASDAQAGIIAILFKYCDDNSLPLLDLNDFKKVLQYATDEGKEEIQEFYGRISTASAGSILRKIVQLEQQGADIFFGEKSFDTDDLLRLDENGRGNINIIRLTDIQDRPKLFSTFMLSLLAEIYSTFPEQGDSDQPELVIFPRIPSTPRITVALVSTLIIAFSVVLLREELLRWLVRFTVSRSF